MDVANETNDDVIYEVDYGEPEGDKEPREQVNEKDRLWCATDGTACAGYLGPGEEHLGILQQSTENLTLRFYDKTCLPQLAGEGDLAPDSRWALVEQGPGSWKIVPR